MIKSGRVFFLIFMIICQNLSAGNKKLVKKDIQNLDKLNKELVKKSGEIPKDGVVFLEANVTSKKTQIIERKINFSTKQQKGDRNVSK